MKPLLRLMPLLLMVAALGQITALAQSVGSAKFPVAYGPTNTGKDFWFSFPANWEYAAGQKYVRLYITAGTKTKVDIYAGTSLLKSVTTVPYDVVTADINQLEAQVFVRNDASPLPADQIYTNKALHVVSEAPIVVYGINRTTATSDGMLVLPVNGLGREYIVASARDISDGGLQRLPSQYMIIAPYDNTQISLINSFKTPSHDEGKLVSFTMNKGDVYSAMSIGFNGDLSGTWISASKPIAVTAGQNCTYLPDQTYPACDHLCEMMLPISSWGKFYHSVPYENRSKGDLYRVFAGEDEAKVYLNGSLYGTLARKGGPEGIGWLQILQTTRELMEFTSDKPIYVAQYNNSLQQLADLR
jgi:adhesin/invasin